MRMFEITCLPSILGQSCQNFTWLVFIDPDLPSTFKNHLIELASLRNQSYVIKANKNSGIRFLKSFNRFIMAESHNVITTNLDDDDAMRFDYIEYLQRHVRSELLDQDQISFRLLGCENATQWDFISSAEAPVGLVKPWSRLDPLEREYPTSAGYSLFVKYPELNFSCQYFPHNLAISICNMKDRLIEGHPRFIDAINPLRKTIQQSIYKTSGRYINLSIENNYHACKLPHPQVIVTNHFDNRSKNRIHETPGAARPVQRNQFFPNIPINEKLAVEYIDAFSK